MKRILFAILATAILVGCSKPQSENKTSTITDSLVLNVMRALIDSNSNVLNIQQDFNILVDTMLFHVQYHPDENIRVGAKSYAMFLSALCMDEEVNLSSEKVQFFLDSMVLKLSYVQSTWYYATPEKDSITRPMLVQHVVKRESDEKNHITVLEVTVDSNDNRIVITLPDDAVSQPYIAFGGDNLNELDTISFCETDAIGILPRDNEGNYTICFDQRVIDEMMRHDVMYIGYMSDCAEIPEDERYCSSMLLLNKFHEQYLYYTNLKN